MTRKHIHGGDIYRHPNVLDFSSNCNPYGMPEGVKKAAAAAIKLAEHYPDVSCTRLRMALSKAEQVPVEQILCGNGAADLIFALALAKKPKKALLLAPTFAEYQQALETVDCEIHYAYLREEHDFVPGEEILYQITEDLDMMFFCNPNNPTGVLASRDYVKKIVEKCKAMNVFLVLDECFLDFVEQGETHTMKPFLKEYSNLFLVKAFTKKYAMPGLRLGYGFCSDTKMLERIKGVMQPWNVSVIAQEAGIAALKEEAYVKETFEKIREQRAFLWEHLEKLSLKLYPSRANYIFFQGPRGLQEQCLKQGIYIRDCSNYEGLGTGFYRIAVRTREENQALLEIFEKLTGKR